MPHYESNRIGHLQTFMISMEFSILKLFYYSIVQCQYSRFILDDTKQQYANSSVGNALEPQSKFAPSKPQQVFKFSPYAYILKNIIYMDIVVVQSIYYHLVCYCP